MLNAYIFFCSNATQQECFDRLLFGGKKIYKKKVPQVNPGDSLFLFNYQEGILHGVFKATSQAEENIEPDTWKRGFPWQVRVSRIESPKPLSRADLIGVLPLSKRGHPPAKLTNEQLENLKALFKSKKRLPNFEATIPFTTLDGHRVRSHGELIIDDWLFTHKILHVYEKQLADHNGTPETMYCDFYIPSTNHYIEFWGLQDKKYIKRKEEKLAFYKDHNLPLIEVHPEDLKRIDEVLNPLL